jgi:hypothetical protein
MPGVSKKRLAQRANALSFQHSPGSKKYRKRGNVEEGNIVHEDAFENEINDEEEDESHIVDQEDVWYDVESNDENSQTKRSLVTRGCRC